MNLEEITLIIEDSLNMLLKVDTHLFLNDISERSLCARWMFHLQNLMPEWDVDVEYNRDGHDPKRLGLDEACANRFDSNGMSFVVPDLIIHKRGPEGPNLLVAEVKKTTNLKSRNCDHKRVVAFCNEFGYRYGAVIELETRVDHEPSFQISHWYSDRNIN